MKYKLLPVLIGFLMMPAIGNAVEVKVSGNTKATADKATANATATTGVKTMAEQQTTRNTLVQPFMPTARMGSWRFGVWRNKRGGYYHKGIDFSGNAGSPSDTVIFSDNGKVSAYQFANNTLAFTRGNGDKVVMLHAAKRAAVKVGSIVEGGKYALTMGRIGANGTATYAKHLHYEYHIPSVAMGRVRFIGLGGFISETTKTQGRGASFHSNTMGTQSGFSGQGYVVTDPTPYLPKDFIYNATSQDLRLEQYIGNSGRTQYNAIYRPNPKLPTGSGAKQPTKQFVNLPALSDNMSPEDIAAMSGGAIDGSLYSGAGGYDIDGSLMSHQMIASFISASDGDAWSSLPQPPKADLASMTPQEIINQISFQRFGNPEWEKAVIKLSSKGLLTEYLLMNAEENFLSQQNQRMKNRIELQLASLTQAQLFEYNKKIEAMNIMVTADAVPKIIDRELKELPNGYYGNGDGGASPNMDMANLPSDLDGLLDALLTAISHKEGPSHDAYNNGTSCANARQGVAYGNGNGKYKPTTMTPVQLIRYYQPNYRHPQKVTGGSNVPCSNRIFASGFVQTVPATLSGLIRDYPEYANQLYTAENQRSLAKRGLLVNTWRAPLKNFLRRGGDDKAFLRAIHSISMEWASIGVPAGYPRNNGSKATDNFTTFYGKGNAANKQSTEMVWAVMKRIQQFHNGTVVPQQVSNPSANK